MRNRLFRCSGVTYVLRLRGGMPIAQQHPRNSSHCFQTGRGGVVLGRNIDGMFDQPHLVNIPRAVRKVHSFRGNQGDRVGPSGCLGGDCRHPARMARKQQEKQSRIRKGKPSSQSCLANGQHSFVLPSKMLLKELLQLFELFSTDFQKFKVCFCSAGFECGIGQCSRCTY
jgi:hypothetical protein